MGAIHKTTGATEPFSEKKLYASLRRSGASKSLADDVLRSTRGIAGEDLTSSELHGFVFERLRGVSLEVAASYRLGRALFELGPEGQIFERFVAELFREQGYRVKNGRILQGRCVTHEVDLIIEKGDRRELAECKHRSSPGLRADVKVALYVQARNVDLQEGGIGHQKFWLIANTKFTRDAIDYGECVGLGLWGWDYPDGESLRDVIERLRLYPITCLNALPRPVARGLMTQGLVLCRDVVEKPDALREVGLGPEFVDSVLEQARVLADGGLVDRALEGGELEGGDLNGGDLGDGARNGDESGGEA